MGNEIDLSMFEDEGGSASLVPESEQVILPGTLEEAFKQDPVRYAEAKKVSVDTGIPVDAVLEDPAHAKGVQKFSKIDMSQLGDESPATADFLAEYDNAVLAQDDVETLGQTEKMLRALFVGAAKGPASAVSAAGAVMDLIQRMDDRMMAARYPEEYAKYKEENRRKVGAVAPYLLDPGASLIKVGERLQESAEGYRGYDPRTEGNFITEVSEAVGQLGWQVGTAITMPWATAPQLGLMGVESQRQRQKASGTYGQDAVSDAGLLTGGAVQVAVERTALNKLIDRVPPQIRNAVVRRSADLLAAFGIEVVSEAADNVAQTLLEKYTSNDEAGVGTAADFAHELAVAGTAAGFVRAVLQVAIPKKVGTYQMSESEKIGAGMKQAKTVEELAAQSRATKMREISPDAYRQALKAQGADDVNIFVDSAQVALMLKEKAPADLADPALQLLKTKLEEASNTGADLRLSATEFMETVAPSKAFEDIRHAVTMTPEAVSPFRAEQDKGTRERTVAGFVEEARANLSQYAEAQEVYESVKAQLIDSGRYSEADARVLSQVVPAWAAARSARTGMSVRQVFEGAGLRIEGPMTGRAEPLDLYAQESDASVLVNIGRSIPTAEGQLLDPDEVRQVFADEGIQVIRDSEFESDSEPTMILQLAEPMSPEQAYRVSERLQQEAIVQMIGKEGALHGPSADKWGAFDPKFFLMPDGSRASDHRDGRPFTGFFGGVATGRTGKPYNNVYEPQIPSLREQIENPESDFGRYHAEYEKHKGNFDNHIALSIPGYRDFQYAIGIALGKTINEGTMLDIGASQGTQAKTITSLSGGKIKTLSLDPNVEMAQTFHDISKVDGAEHTMTALSFNRESGFAWTEKLRDESGAVISEHDINYFDDAGRKFDVVQESMVFQFIDNNRREHIARMAELTAEGGLAIVQEKVFTDAWASNEAAKNKYKARFFRKEDMDAKSAEVLEGMSKNMVAEQEVFAALQEKFDYVEQIWDSGNFKGFVASNSKEKLAEFMKNLPNTETEYDTRYNPNTPDMFAQDSLFGREEDGSLRGLPRVRGAKVFPTAVEVAKKYMAQAGLQYSPPSLYAQVDEDRARRIAEAYAAMPHAPNDPEVKAAYDAMIKETLEQYKAILETGLVVEFIDFEKQGDPYAATPRMANEDVVQNNHLWVFSTRDGFGVDAAFDPSENPLLQETEFTDANGKPMLANDVFRVVHDYFGHVKEGTGFRADGEENAWRAHSAMYSPLARRAMTTETRGQNSWVNYGPYGETNRTASADKTHYADQKTGLLPQWVVDEGRYNPNTPDMFTQAPLGSDGFKAWFADSKVVDEDGAPLVVYHGTTADFSSFDTSKANVESNLGAGFYFTNTKADVSPNYAGEGPDLVDKIEMEAGRIARETDRDYGDPDVIQEARARFVQHGGAVLPVYLSLQNPIILGGEAPTWLTYEQEFDEEGDHAGGPTGTLVDFIKNLSAEASKAHGSVSEAVASLHEMGREDGGMSAEDVLSVVDENVLSLYAPDTGGYLVDETIRRAFELSGFDGYIDYTVNAKFGEQGGWVAGMPGVNEGTVHYVAFRPEQIKSAIGNSGKFNPNDPDILAQSWYYSPTLAAAEGLKQEKGTAEQMLSMLKKNGAKPKEIEAIGLPEYLAIQEGSVTKAQLIEFIRTNGVVVDEVQKGEEVRAEVYEQDGKWYVKGAENLGFSETRESAIDLAERPDVLESMGFAPEFTKYATKGGSDYRELLLTLPRKAPDVWESKTYDPLIRDTQGLLDSLEGDSPDVVEYRSRLLKNLAQYKRERDAEAKRSATLFTDGHWREKNVLAHVRFKTTTDADGKKVLLLEEIQSDWAQKGRKEGFEEKYKLEDIVIVPEEKLSSPVYWEYEVPGNEIALLKTKFATAEEGRQYIAREKVKRNGHKPAPFVTNTDAWVGLVTKRMLAYAVENGFDRVSWVPGQMQAERYSLAGAVEQIYVGEVDPYNRTAEVNLYMKDEDQGVYAFIVNQESGVIEATERRSGEQFVGQRLHDVIGAEWADTVLASDENETFDVGDVAIGGEGMIGFYDNVVPKVVKSIIGKMDKSVDVTWKDVGAVPSLDDAAKSLFGLPYDRLFPGQKADAEALAKSGKIGDDVFSAMGFDITEAIRGATKSGLSLFQKGKGPGARGYYSPSERLIRLTEASDLSTFLHEFGHFMLDMEPMNSQIRIDINAWYSRNADAVAKEANSYVGKVMKELEQPAAHGSGALFSRFSKQFVGSGEGFAAHGWGLYFTSSDDLAGHYARSQASRTGKGYTYKAEVPDDDMLLDSAATLANQPAPVKTRLDGILEKFAPARKSRTVKVGGVEIDRMNPQYQAALQIYRIGFDAYLSRQMQLLADAEALGDADGISRGQARLDAAMALEGASIVVDEGTIQSTPETATASQLYDQMTIQLGSKRAASEYLMQLGIPGLTYTGDLGDRNFVIWDDAAVTISDVSEQEHEIEILRQMTEGAGVSEGDITADDVRTYVAAGTTGDDGKDAAIRVALHEQFARAWETYLMEGKAPSVELRNAFRKFAAWLAEIYRSVGGALGVNMDAGIRSVFDRLLATEEQISVAAARAEYAPLFTDAAMAGMTEEEYAKYLEKSQDSVDEAKETVRDKLIKELRRSLTKQWRDEKADVVDEIMPALQTEKVYAAMERLKSDLPLDKATVKEMVGEAAESKKGTEFVRVPVALRGMTKDGGEGLHPDLAAALLGYTSGAEMLNDIMKAAPIRKEAEARADKIMLERHGDSLNDGTVERMADDALANDARADVMVDELNALISEDDAKYGKLLLAEFRAVTKQGGSGVDRQAVQSLAAERIAKLTYRELHPGVFRKAEIRAARDAGAAMATGNKQGAAEAKMRQLINFYLGKEAQKAKDDIESLVGRMARYEKKSVREAIMSSDGGHWEQIRKILRRFELRKSATLTSVEEGNVAVQAWMASRIEEFGDGLVLTPEILDETYKTHWKNIPYSQLSGIFDSVRNIEHVARYSNKIDLLQEKMDFNVLVDKWVTQIRKQPKIFDRMKRTNVIEGRKTLPWAMAQMTKIPFLASWLDGGERVGLSHDLLVQPFVEAFDRKQKLWRQTGEVIMQAVDDRLREDHARMGRKIYIPQIKDSLYGHQVLAVALNTGNAGNLRKLLLGEGWADPENPETVSLDNPALQAVLRHMTKSDWDLVQLMWDQMDLLYPDLANVHRETTGLVPPKVEATEVVTPFGAYRGGYYPVKYDPMRSDRAEDFQAQADAETESMFSAVGIQASVNAGAVNERSGFYAPIRLSLDVVPTHFQETIHYISHHNAVRTVNRLIRDKRVASAIRETMGPDEYAQLRPWLNDIAKDGREAPMKMYWDAALRRLRFGATLGYMGFKVSTGLMQLTGLTTTASEVGPKYVIRGLRMMMRSTKDMQGAMEFAVENSKVMAHRMDSFDRDVRAAFAILERKNGVLASVQELSMKHIALIQTYIIDLPSWYAAYCKELESSGDEDRAIKYADWVVENVQGSGRTANLAAIMRSQKETDKMFTMFMTFFSTLWNMERDLARGAKKGGRYSATDVGARAAFLFIIPVIAEMAIRGELFGDDDDEETVAEKAMMKMALYPMASIPFVRDVASGVAGGFGYNMNPLSQLLETGVTRIPKLIEGTLTDEEISRSTAKGSFVFMGAVFGIPGTTQAWGTGEHLYKVIEKGEELTVKELLYGPDRK